MWDLKYSNCLNLLLNLLSVLTLLPTVHTYLAVHLDSNEDLYSTPCPGIFNYYLQDGVLQYGVVQVNCPEDTTLIQLHVELSVGNQVQGYNGELVLASSRDETIQNILQRKRIMYKLHFPRWYNYPPRVTKVLLNGQLLCQGPSIDIKAVRILTTINLHHTLKLNITPRNGFIFNPKTDLPNIPSTSITDGSGIPSFPHQPQQPESPSVTMIPYINDPESVIDFNPGITPKYYYYGTDPIQVPQPATIPTTVTVPSAPTVRRSTELPQFPQQKQPVRIPDRGSFNNHGINDDQCGISLNTNKLIARGRNVQQGQYPWLVAMFVTKSLGLDFLCGASLISRKHVITAGHCMKQGTIVLSPKKIYMRVGEHNIHVWQFTEGSSMFGAERVMVHPDYKTMSADGDIAMVVLSSEVTYTKLIRPICMWRNGDTSLDRIVGVNGTVVGWGKDENDNMVTPEPKQINFPVVSQEDCLRSHFTFREITSDRTFCAGYKNGSGPCNGDSGGGFIIEQNGRWFLRGIVSMSIAKDRSCDFSQYFVFTDITKFYTWIDSNL